MTGLDPAIHAPDTPLLDGGAAVDHRVTPGDDDGEYGGWPHV